MVRLEVRVPHAAGPKGCGTKRIAVPWARPGSGFTLLFESLLLTLHHHIDKARSNVDHSSVTRIGMHETSSKRGHQYITLYFDMDERTLLFATEGKDKATVKAFKGDFEAHNGCSVNGTV